MEPVVGKMEGDQQTGAGATPLSCADQVEQRLEGMTVWHCLTKLEDDYYCLQPQGDRRGRMRMKRSMDSSFWCGPRKPLTRGELEDHLVYWLRALCPSGRPPVAKHLDQTGPLLSRLEIGLEIYFWRESDHDPENQMVARVRLFRTLVLDQEIHLDYDDQPASQRPLPSLEGLVCL